MQMRISPIIEEVLSSALKVVGMMEQARATNTSLVSLLDDAAATAKALRRPKAQIEAAYGTYNAACVGVDPDFQGPGDEGAYLSMCDVALVLDEVSSCIYCPRISDTPMHDPSTW